MNRYMVRIKFVRFFKLIRIFPSIFIQSIHILGNYPYKNNHNALKKLGRFLLKSRQLFGETRLEPFFNQFEHKAQYPNVRLKEKYSLLYYIIKSNGRSPQTLFDRRYLESNPDLVQWSNSLLSHYAKFRHLENRHIGKNEVIYGNSFSQYQKIKVFITKPKQIFPNFRVEFILESALSINVLDSGGLVEFENIFINTKVHQYIVLSEPERLPEVQVLLKSNDIQIRIISPYEIVFDMQWLRFLIQINMSNSQLNVKRLKEDIAAILIRLNTLFNTRRLLENAKMSIEYRDVGDKTEEDRLCIETVTRIGTLKDRQRLLLISHEDTYTGAPIYLLQMAKYLRQVGNDVKILCLRKGFRNGLFTKAGFDTVYVEDLHTVKGKSNIVDTWLLSSKGLLEVRKFFSEEKPDQIWVNSINASDMVLAANKCNIPSVLFVHESFGFSGNDRYPQGIFETVFAKALNAAALVVHGSNFSRSAFQFRNNFANSIVMNSIRSLSDSDFQNSSRVQARMQLNVDEDEIVYLCVATFEERKRLSDIIHAFSQITHNKRRLMLVGDLGKTDEYSSHIRFLAEKNFQIQLFPVQEDLSNFYLAADLFVFASEKETFPLVLQEAAGYQLPRCVTRYPGFADSVSEFDSYLFEVGETHALSQIMENFMNNPEELAIKVYNGNIKYLSNLKLYENQIQEILAMLGGLTATLTEGIYD